MTFVELDLASTLSRMARFTGDSDQDHPVDASYQVEGFDPATSTTLTVNPTQQPSGSLTCHILFPEVRLSTVPRAIELVGSVIAGKVHFVIDASDESGPCIAVPLGHNLKPGHLPLQIDVDGKPFMVWKEKRQRAIVPPVRFKYLLVISPQGQPFTITLSRLRFHL